MFYPVTVLSTQTTSYCAIREVKYIKNLVPCGWDLRSTPLEWLSSINGDLDLGSAHTHTIVHHSRTFIYKPNLIEI